MAAGHEADSLLGVVQRGLYWGFCAAAGWSLPSTFTRFYNLNVSALQTRMLSV